MSFASSLLYVLVVLVFLGPIEAFLRFRLWRTSRHGAGGVYLARSDPWVSAVVALAGLEHHRPRQTPRLTARPGARPGLR